MIPSIATFLFTLGVIGLFLLDRDKTVQTSKALWLPVFWVLIVGSRPVSVWLGIGPVNNLQTADKYLDGSPFDKFLLSGMLVAGLIVLARRGAQVGKILRRNSAILLFFAYCGVSVLWSDYSDVSFKRWVKAVSDLVMVLIVLTDMNPPAAP